MSSKGLFLAALLAGAACVGQARAQASISVQPAMAPPVVTIVRAPATVSTAVPSPASAGYDQSVRALMAAADSLRASIHVMAREPAGEQRNQAIRDANRALIETQVAMANAYDATAFPHRTATMGAGPLQCAWLGTMWGCS